MNESQCSSILSTLCVCLQERNKVSKASFNNQFPWGDAFFIVGVDVLQLLPSYNSNQYAIVFMDYHGKWPEVFAAADQKVEMIAQLLVNM